MGDLYDFLCQTWVKDYGSFVEMAKVYEADFKARARTRYDSRAVSFYDSRLGPFELQVATPQYEFNIDEWDDNFNRAYETCLKDVARWIDDYMRANPDKKFHVAGPDLYIERKVYRIRMFAWMEVWTTPAENS